MRTKTSSDVYVARNKIYNIDFAANMDPDLLIGVFSVSATKKVQFTKGNLRATYNSETSTYSWDFFEDQDNYRGGGEFLKGNTTIDNQVNNGVVDLFGWSTSSTNYGIKTSTTNWYYSGDFNDWGALFEGRNYYTLTNDEWTYLLTGRTCTNRFAKARISHNGLLIFPDNYNGTTEVTGKGIAQVNSATADYPTDYIDQDTWKEMEDAGVVFLPAAGYRTASEVSFENQGGYYWSSVGTSEVRETSGGRETYYFAYLLSFNKDNAYTHEGNRCVGKTVRLVSTVSK